MEEGTFFCENVLHTANLGMKELRNAKIPILQIPSNARNVMQKRTFCKPHSKNKSHFPVRKEKCPNLCCHPKFMQINLHTLRGNVYSQSFNIYILFSKCLFNKIKVKIPNNNVYYGYKMKLKVNCHWWKNILRR